jgi:hypothetical protein
MFPQPKNFTCKVSRYLDFASAVSQLQTETLFFSRSDLFQDKHEGTITRLQAEACERIAANFNAPQLEDIMIVSRKCVRKAIFINCWHLNDFESEAMWQLYCPNGQGIAIQTTYSKLAKWTIALPKTVMGTVTYIDYESEKFDLRNPLNAFMHKRRSFTHESEVRIIYSDLEKLRKYDNKTVSDLEKAEQDLSGQPSGKSLEFPLEKNVDFLFVNPYAPEWYFEVFRQLVLALKPKLAGRIQKSELKELPRY